MNYTEEEFQKYFLRYQEFVNHLLKLKNYPENISHLLHLIVPAFVFKYGVSSERFILSVFQDVDIVIQDRKDSIHQAAFYRTLIKTGEGYTTKKYVFLYNYQNISLMQLLDNLVHELNHAVNSIKNEILVDEKGIFVRTGLTYLLYDKITLEPIQKQDEFLLEEIINTRQTEKIIELICSFSKYSIHDVEVANVLYSISSNYRSNAYYLQAEVCKKLLTNTTFIHTLENLRFQGEVQNIAEWFDQIVGKTGSYVKFNQLLLDVFHLERNLGKGGLFQKRKIQKICLLNSELFRIVDLFDQNCNFR